MRYRFGGTDRLVLRVNSLGQVTGVSRGATVTWYLDAAGLAVATPLTLVEGAVEVLDGETVTDDDGLWPEFDGPDDHKHLYARVGSGDLTRVDADPAARLAVLEAEEATEEDLTLQDVADAVTEHLGVGDPHPQYLTSAEADAAYDPIGAAEEAAAALVGAAPEALDTLVELANQMLADEDAVAALVNLVATKVANDDPRLTDERIPTGGAGGVLAGQYPNPGFAVDMATQAELVNEVEARETGDALRVPRTADGSGTALGLTFTLDWSGVPAPGSGLAGLRLDRSGLGVPLGLMFSTAGVPEWDIGMDNLSSDMVLLADHQAPNSTTGVPGFADQIRVARGFHMLAGRSVGHPDNKYRIRIDGVAADPITMVDLVVLNGSTAASGGFLTHLFRAENEADSVLSVMAAGRVGVGVKNPTQRLHVAQVQDATTQLLLSNLSATAGARASLRVQADAKSAFLEMFSSTFATVSLRNTAYLSTSAASDLAFGPGGAERARFDANGNLFLGAAALAVAAVNGFVYLPSMPGIPTGVPTAKAGLFPGVIDSVNQRLYVPFGGVWKYVQFQ